MIHGSQQADKKPKENRILVSLLLLVIGLRKYCRVFGDSMIPTLYEGDLLIYKPFNHQSNEIEVGNLIILRLPVQEEVLIVKRVFSINSNHIEVRGDNESYSIDSREFGPISYKQIKGIVEHIIPLNTRYLSI